MESILTVIEAAATQDLTTLATVKTALSIAGGESDALLRALITQASADCADWCGRKFGLETVTETFRLSWPGLAYLAPNAGPGDRAYRGDLVLTRRPVVSITTVIEAGATLDSADYALQAEAGILTRLRSDTPCAWLAGTIAVTYAAGYDLVGNLPPAIERACIEVVKALWDAGSRDPALRQINIPGVVERQYWVDSTAPGLPRSATDRLQFYRDYRV